MSDLFQKSLRVYGYYPDLIAENKRLREALILVRDVVGESGAAVIIDAALAQEESEWLERYHDGKKWTSRPIPQEKSE